MPHAGVIDCPHPPDLCHGFQVATTDTDTVTGWWSRWPAGNIGIATGDASGIWGLDVDEKNGYTGSATLACLEREHGDLPMTYTVGTGSGGVHHVFSYDGVDFDLRGSARKLGNGLDTRANGGYIVAPPSRANDPKHFMAYTVLVDVEPVPAPAWLLGLLRPKPKPPASPFARPAAAAKGGSRGTVDGVLGFLAAARPEGTPSQHDALVWALVKLAEHGVTRRAAEALVTPVVLAWPCSGRPWTDGDVETQLASVYDRGYRPSKGAA
ncbi:hypothetical protein QFZ76_007362 [Streptomyces sp. V4I2]|nr:hypothetical protein [Streptomyces sp. V4I2]